MTHHCGDHLQDLSADQCNANEHFGIKVRLSQREMKAEGCPDHKAGA